MSTIFKSLALAAGIATAVATFSAAPNHGPSTAAPQSTTSSVAAHPKSKQSITVVLVHGAWADSSSWSGETARLLAAGYRVRTADTGDKNLDSDVAGLEAFLTTIPGPVLLVGHSYGGAVITNAAAHAKNVVGLVYVDAFEPAPGESVAELGGTDSVVNTLPSDQLFDDVPGAPSGTENLLLTKDTYLHHFASDVPRAEATALWASQTVTNTAALKSPTVNAAWRTLPSWAFISTGDQIITPDSLQSMARRASSEVTTFRGGSHVTLISHPEAVTKTIVRALDFLSS